MKIVRTLEKGSWREEDARVVSPVPGSFDGHGVFFDGTSVQFVEDLGWIVLYVGARFEGEGGRKITRTGTGLFLLDRENPERIFYRTAQPIEGTDSVTDGWKVSLPAPRSADLLLRAVDLVPQKVRQEVRRLYEVKPMPSGMTKWLKQKSGLA